MLHPREGNEGRSGFQQGTADVLWRNANLIREFDPAALVVVSADAVYKLDYRALVEEHCEAGKAVTLVTTTVDPEDAGRYGVVQAEDGQVTGYALKPDDPEGNLIANEVFVFEPHRVLDTLDELAEQAGEDGLEDLGHELLPRLVDDGEVCEHRFDGYWRDVGTIDAYWECHQELVQDEPPIDLDEPAWPILTHAQSNRASGRICSSAEIVSSLIAPGATVAGSVRAQRDRARRARREGSGGARRRPAPRQHRARRGDGRARDPRRRCRGPQARVGEPDGEIALVGTARRRRRGRAARRRRALPRLRLTSHSSSTARSAAARLSAASGFSAAIAGVDVGQRQLGGDEARHQPGEVQAVREPLLGVVPALARRAGRVAAAARGEHDQVAAAEQALPASPGRATARARSGGRPTT